MGLNANICGLARVLKNDIDALLDCDLSYIHTFIGTSPLHRDCKLKISKEKVIDKGNSALEYAKDHGITVEFSAEDATRTEEEYLIDMYKALKSAGVDLINVLNTCCILVPTTFKNLISKLEKELSLPISVHFHNDFGLAVANSLVAIESGVEQAHVNSKWYW